jgi:hypothetical protein
MIVNAHRPPSGETATGAFGSSQTVQLVAKNA